MSDAARSPEITPKPTRETEPVRRFFDERIDLGQDPPVYRTQTPDGGIYTWDASALRELSLEERNEMLPDLLPEIGSVAEVAIRNIVDYLFEPDPQSSETRIEQNVAFSRDLNQKTVSGVFRLLIAKAQEKGEWGKVIALRLALQNGSRLTSSEIQNRIREIQTEQDISPQKAFELLLFRDLDPKDLKPLGSDRYLLVTVSDYTKYKEENEAISQPVKENLGTTVRVDFDLKDAGSDGLYIMAANRRVDRLREQLGDKILKVQSDDKGITISFELNRADLQQRDLKAIDRVIGIFKHCLDYAQRQRPDWTVGQELQKIIQEREKNLQARSQASPYLQFGTDIELDAQTLRILRFFEKNLDIAPGLRKIILGELQENDSFQFTRAMRKIKPIEEGAASRSI